METLHFSTSINASKERVWEILWNDDNYRKWTSVFCAGSYAESDWNEGSKILFLDGDRSGMISKIETKKPYEQMVFKHLGEVKNGVEDTESEAVKKWANALEGYRLSEEGGVTELVVEMDVFDDFKEYIEKTFPKALEQIKILSESN
jgi:hypothetical protein